jgi:hypothetical protein
MSILIQGRTVGLVVVVISFILFQWLMNKTKTGYTVTVRNLPPIEALPEAIGRAAEMGKPVYYTTACGGQTLNHARDGPQTIAGISILKHAAQLTAEAGVDIAYYTPIADSLPLVEETMRAAYIEAGKPEDFYPEMVQFQAGQSPYLTASLGYMQRERPASLLMFGCFYYESVVLGEGGNSINAMQITGCAKASQLAFLVATSDYVLLGEELFAAGASISQDQEMLATLRVEDWIKAVVIGLLTLGAILSSIGINIVANIMGL